MQSSRWMRRSRLLVVGMYHIIIIDALAGQKCNTTSIIGEYRLSGQPEGDLLHEYVNLVGFPGHVCGYCLP